MVCCHPTRSNISICVWSQPACSSGPHITAMYFPSQSSTHTQKSHSDCIGMGPYCALHDQHSATRTHLHATTPTILNRFTRCERILPVWILTLMPHRTCGEA